MTNPYVRSAAATLLTTAVLVTSLRADIIQQVLVKVNGDIISKTDFEQRQVAVLRQRNQPLTNDDDLKKAIAESTPDIILDAVDELLMQQRGRELGYRMTDENFKRIVEQIRTENKLENDAQFEAALKQEGMSLADLRKALERQMLVSQVQQQEIMAKIAVTEDEARAYYEQHRGEFTTEPSITLREILVTVPESKDATGQPAVNVADDEAARDKAMAARARVVKGEDFGQVASEVSEAPSRANGGVIGPISPNELAPDLGKLVSSMKVGDVSDPLRTARGYQILKLDASTAAVIETFDRARDRISEKVAADKRQGEFLRYLERLRAQAIIEWKNDELKKAYEQALAARQARLTATSS